MAKLGVLAIAIAFGCNAPRPGGDSNSGTESTDPTQGSTPGESGSGEEEEEEGTTEPGDEESSGSTGDPPDDPGDPWEPVPPFEPLPEDAVAELRGVIDGILGDGAVASATQGVLVVDLETEQVLYERNPDVAIVPASNTKLFTTGASVDILGEDHRMITDVVADVEPDGSGIVNGDLHLVGDHDFTWSTYFYASARFPLDRLAAQLYEEGLRQVTGAAIARGEFCWEGYSTGTYDATAHRSAAASQFLAALNAAGITVNGGSSNTPEFDPPAGGVTLASWASVPIAQASVHINGPSHNEFADILLRHLGWHSAAHESTYAAGAAEMIDWMPSLPTTTRGVAWNDGSGLSHGNRVSPRNIVDLIRYSTTVPQGEAWLRSLAISGVRGTIGSRMTGGDTWGRVFGKTGTLGSIGVVALSGVLYHAYDGRRYAFSILFNGAYDVDGARAVEDELVEAFAVDLRAVGGKPAAPTLRRVVDDGPTVMELQWTEVPDVDGYAVWLSPDGKSFAIEDARYVHDTVYRAGQLPWSPTYVRVTSVIEVPEGPVHSDASDVYGSRPTEEGAAVLVVDGNDRWQAEPVIENPRGIGHDFALAHGTAIGELGFDIAANEAVVEGDVDLSDYEVVLWALGEESDVDRSFDELEQQAIADYVAGGGAIMVSGSEFGYDLVELGTPEDTAFMLDVLRAGYEGDDAATPLVGKGTGPFADVGPLQFYTPADADVGFPDLLAPAGGSTAVLQYLGGTGSTAGVAFEGDGRTIVLGFPFESIDNASDRALVMERSLAFLTGG